MLEREKPNGAPSALPTAKQKLPTHDSSLASSPADTPLAKSPLSDVAIGAVSILPLIDQFLSDMAAAPQELAGAKELTRELVVAATNKFELLNDGRYWSRFSPTRSILRFRNRYNETVSRFLLLKLSRFTHFLLRSSVTSLHLRLMLST